MYRGGSVRVFRPLSELQMYYRAFFFPSLFPPSFDRGEVIIRAFPLPFFSSPPSFFCLFLPFRHNED